MVRERYRTRGFIRYIAVALCFLLAFSLIPHTSYGEEITAQDSAAQSDSDIGSVLTDCYVQIKPQGFYREANAYNDGYANYENIQLFSLGSSSKVKLLWDSRYEGYNLSINRGFNESNAWSTGHYWDVEDRSTSEGSGIHAWVRKSDNPFQAWRFYQNDDGSYYIKSVGSLSANNGEGLYLSLRDVGVVDGTSPDKNGNQLVQRAEPFKWEVEVFSDDSDQQAYDSYQDGARWMSYLDDSKLLSNISIPGTHDTGATYIDAVQSPQTSQTQTQKLYYPDQLRAGFRSFDIRMGERSGGSAKIVHGSNLFTCKNRDGSIMHFSDIMKESKMFLSQNPSETIIMTIANNGGSNKDITAEIESYIIEPYSIIWDGEGVPTLGEARGKIVLLRRYQLVDKADFLDESRFGIPVTNWDNPNPSYHDATKAVQIYPVDGSGQGLATNGETEVWAQDFYNTTGTTKIGYVNYALIQSFDSQFLKDHPKAYFFNYASCTNSNPFTAARYVLEHLILDDHIEYDQKGFFGIVVMDFADASWAENIYRSNFASDIRLRFPDATLTYGQNLGEAQLVGGLANVKGSFSFEDGNTISPSVADSEHTLYTMVFTPDDDSIAPIRQSKTVKVNPRMVKIGPVDERKEYGDSLMPSEEGGYIDYAFISGTNLAPGETKEDFGLYLYAYEGKDPQGQKISAQTLPGSYRIGYAHHATNSQGKPTTYDNYIVSVSGISYEAGGTTKTYYTITPRTALLQWSDKQVWLPSDTEPVSVSAEVANLVGSDVCTVTVENGTNTTVGAHRAYASNLSNEFYRFETDDRTRQRFYAVYDGSNVIFPTQASLSYGQDISEASLDGGYAPVGSFELVTDGEDVQPHAGEYDSGYLVRYTLGGTPVPGITDQAISVSVVPKTIKASWMNKFFTTEYGSSLPAYDFEIDPTDLVYPDTKADLRVRIEAVDNEGDLLSNNEFSFEGAAYNNTPVGIYRIQELSEPADNPDKNTDYELEFDPAYQVITQRTIEHAWQNHLGLSYDGNAKEVSALITNLVPLDPARSGVVIGGLDASQFDDCTLQISGGTATNAGAYLASIEAVLGEKAPNYTLPYDALLQLEYSIAKAHPQVTTFPTSATLTLGTALSSAQLDRQGTSDIAGTFKFVREGYVPEEAGIIEAYMTFIPDDLNNYQRLYAIVAVDVQAQPDPTPPGPTPPSPTPPNPTPPIPDNGGTGMPGKGSGLAPTSDTLPTVPLLGLVALISLWAAIVSGLGVMKAKNTRKPDR